MFLYRTNNNPYHERRFVAHDGAVTGLCRHPFNDKLASVGEDRVLRFWTPDGRYHSQVRLAYANKPTCFLPGPVAWSAEGRFLAVGAGPEIYVIDAGRGRVVRLIDTGLTVEALAWSGTRDLSAVLFDGTTVRFTEILVGSFRPPISVRLKAEDMYAGQKLTLVFDDLRPRHTGAALAEVRPGFGFAFMGERLVVRDGHKTGALTLPGELGAIAMEPYTRTLLVACGPDSRYVHHVRFPDTGPHVFARDDQPHEDPVSVAACRPGYYYHATGDRGGRAVFWDAGPEFHDPRPLKVLEGHAGTVLAMTFLSGLRPDQARLVTGGEDGTIRRWDVDLPSRAPKTAAEAGRRIDL